jgi:DNA-binding NtrC family response regulator
MAVDRDGTVTERHLDARPIVAFDVTVARGVDAGKRVTVGEDRIVVGTAPNCDLVLTDPRVSRRHLALAIVGGRLQLDDLDSTNGTFVSGLRVKGVTLAGGESIQLGRTVLEVGAQRLETAESRLHRTSFGRIVGASAAMQKVYRLAERVAATDISVLLEGETGTGKEQLAEAIHEASARARGPFVVFDCTTVAPNLMEATLFGHEKGAFTGAVAERRGVFEQAHGGTLFLDEIGDLDPALQPKLLRALQRKEIQRIGGTKWLSFDVRILAATRRDLDKEVQAGRFRDDLYYRLAVASIELPPLRDREGDVVRIAQAVWGGLGGGAGPFPDASLARYESYAWPGNVRELVNVVTRWHALGDEYGDQDAEARDPVGSAQRATPIPAGEDLAARLIREGVPFPKARDRVLSDFERRYVAAVLDKHGGNVTRAAEASGIGRRYFHMLLAKKG